MPTSTVPSVSLSAVTQKHKLPAIRPDLFEASVDSVNQNEVPSSLSVLLSSNPSLAAAASSVSSSSSFASALSPLDSSTSVALKAALSSSPCLSAHFSQILPVRSSTPILPSEIPTLPSTDALGLVLRQTDALLESGICSG